MTKISDIISKKIKTIKRDTCITKSSSESLLSKFITIFNKLGSGDNKQGEVYRACWMNKKECEIGLAVKKIPLYKADYKYISKPFDFKTLNHSHTFSELHFLRILTLLVKQNICINVPVLHRFFICDNCKFDNKYVNQDEIANKCLILVTDLAEYTLKSFLEEPHTLEEIYSAYLQIYIGIYTINKYFGIIHHDLHADNVLVHKIKAGGYWEYKIEKKTIRIPNYGYLFVLWDFGYSRIPDIIEPATLEWLHSRESERTKALDYLRITEWIDTAMISGNGGDDNIPRKLEKLLRTALKKLNPVKVIYVLAQNLKGGISGECIGKYNTTKKLNHKGIKITEKIKDKKSSFITFPNIFKW